MLLVFVLIVLAFDTDAQTTHCIIGGGTAGLAAANELLYQYRGAGATVEIRIYESNNRLGGRLYNSNQPPPAPVPGTTKWPAVDPLLVQSKLYTKTEPNKPPPVVRRGMDFGGQWMHGYQCNPLTDLLTQLESNAAGNDRPGAPASDPGVLFNYQPDGAPDRTRFSPSGGGAAAEGFRVRAYSEYTESMLSGDEWAQTARAFEKMFEDAEKSAAQALMDDIQTGVDIATRFTAAVSTAVGDLNDANVELIVDEARVKGGSSGAAVLAAKEYYYPIQQNTRAANQGAARQAALAAAQVAALGNERSLQYYITHHELYTMADEATRAIYDTHLNFAFNTDASQSADLMSSLNTDQNVMPHDDGDAEVNAPYGLATVWTMLDKWNKGLGRTASAPQGTKAYYNIMRERRVTNVDCDITGRNKCKITFVSTLSQLIVTTSDCDTVLVTVPLGVLKRAPNDGGIAFTNTATGTPMFTANKQDAIRRLGFGTLNKLFLQWYEIPKGWPNTMDDYSLGYIARGGNSFFPNIINVLPVYGEPILAFLCGGSIGETLEEEDLDTLVERALSIARKVLSIADLPYPDAAYMTMWHRNPNAYGVYTYVPPKVFYNSAAIDQLAAQNERAGGPAAGPAAPVIGRNPFEDYRQPIQQVFFAGEGTHEKRYGYADGAYMSGISAARQMQAYILQNPVAAPCAEVLPPDTDVVVAPALVPAKCDCPTSRNYVGFDNGVPVVLDCYPNTYARQISYRHQSACVAVTHPDPTVIPQKDAGSNYKGYAGAPKPGVQDTQRVFNRLSFKQERHDQADADHEDAHEQVSHRPRSHHHHVLTPVGLHRRRHHK